MIIYSFLICTCNPAPDTLEKVIASCAGQQFERDLFEIIVTDNNSAAALAGMPFIKDLVGKKMVRLTNESKQGLAYARITASRAAQGDTLVFVDDDNILNSDYLKNLQKLQHEHPPVAAWGPGEITVTYKGNVPQWVKKNYSWLFQQKKRKATQFGCVPEWPDYYPAGSGLCVSRDVMAAYTTAFERGELTLTGRKGNVLSSAEDTQIVWTAVKIGLSAGTSPLLKLEHVIPSSRASLSYLSSLNYGIARSYALALKEMFPEKAITLKKRSLAGKLNFIFKMFLKAHGNPVAFYRYYSIENSWYRAIESTQI